MVKYRYQNIMFIYTLYIIKQHYFTNIILTLIRYIQQLLNTLYMCLLLAL